MLLSVLASPVAAAGSPPLVTAVELRSDARLAHLDELRELVTVAVGDRLEPDAVGRSLRNLHAYGGGEIAAFTRPYREGVALVFGVWARIEVEEVRIVGELGRRRQQLLGALAQRAEQPLSESKVIRGVYALQDLYWTFGFREAVVRVAVDVDEARRTAIVTYHVASGPRANVGEVTFSGELGELTPEQLRGPLRSEPGRHHHEVTAANDVERLEGWLIGRGYRTASVDPAEDRYDPEANVVDLTFAVRPGPLFVLEAPGVDVARLRRRGLLEFLGRERFDETLLAQSRDALVRHYQERGHYDVDVQLETEPVADRIVIRLAIEPGPVYELREVGFRGNEAFDDAQLAALMDTSAAIGAFGGRSRLVDEVVEEDLANVRSFYALQGYGEAEAGPAEVGRFGSVLRLTVPIAEGPQRRVVALGFQGASLLEPGELLAGLALQPAGPYHPRLLEQSLEQLRARYEEAGMGATQVAADLEWNDERTLADVRFRVLEGPRSEIDRIIVRGQHRTRPEVIRRVVQLGPREPLSAGRLLEAQRRLYELAIFSRAEVRMAPGLPFSAERDVLVRVEEGRNRKVTYGVGWDSEDGLRGLLGVAHRNLLGRAVSGRLDVRASQRESQIRALVRQPFFGRLRWPVTYSLFRIEESRDSFDSKRRGAQVEGLRLAGNNRYGLLLSYRENRVSDPDPALQDLEIQPELREAEVLSLGPSIFFDRRDDPFDPRRGWSTNLVLEKAVEALGADTEFLKLFGQQTYNLDLRRFGVVSGSFRLGAIEPQGGGNIIDPTVPAGLASAEIPISERFFAGGRSTHRAYRRERLGIVGETLLPFLDPDDPNAEERLVPIGGNALALVNIDYRFPIIGPVGGVAFVDAGNVWADWRDIDPTQAKVGAGVGVRYLSPIGPVRLEIGWKLDREPEEDPFVVLFSVGNPF